MSYQFSRCHTLIFYIGDIGLNILSIYSNGVENQFHKNDLISIHKNIDLVGYRRDGCKLLTDKSLMLAEYLMLAVGTVQ